MPLLILSLFTLTLFAQPPEELNTLLMNTTFEIFGPAHEVGKTTLGTVFVMGKPIKDVPGRGYTILITAAHVLDEISGDDAGLLMRRKSPDGTFSTFTFPFKIRANGKDLYVKNPAADVAAMYLRVPSDLKITTLTIERLVTDADLEKYEIHPGDELLCLGFPLAANIHGFPILRSGKIASYPLTPAKTITQYYYDFHVYKGNSGGPVYYSYSNRTYANQVHLGETIQGVVGLVIQETNSTLPEFKDLSLNLGVVVPAMYIKETIDQLPSEPPLPPSLPEVRTFRSPPLVPPITRKR